MHLSPEDAIFWGRNLVGHSSLTTRSGRMRTTCNRLPFPEHLSRTDSLRHSSRMVDIIAKSSGVGKDGSGVIVRARRLRSTGSPTAPDGVSATSIRPYHL